MNRKKLIYGIIILISIIGFYGCTTEKSSQKNHIKVFFANEFRSENSQMQSFEKWYSGSSKQKYSLKELYSDGWEIEAVSKINASAREWQMVFFMKITDDKYQKVKSKYIKEEISVKVNKPVSAENAL